METVDRGKKSRDQVRSQYGNRRQGTKWTEDNHGTILDFSRNWSTREFQPQFRICFICSFIAPHIPSWIKPSQYKDPSNLLNCYPVSWKVTKFRSLYRHSQNGDGTGGQTRVQRQCDFTDNFSNSSRRLQREVWKKNNILAHRMLHF
jgi:hypothetical protein